MAWMEDKGYGGRTIIRGDFNTRGRRRITRSKNRKVNGKGKKLVEFVEEKGWDILNGCMQGDEEGEYTFSGGRNNTVIDYVIGDEEIRDKVKELKMGDKMDSDHQPLELWMRERVKRERKEDEERKEGKR